MKDLPGRHDTIGRSHLYTNSAEFCFLEKIFRREDSKTQRTNSSRLCALVASFWSRPNAARGSGSICVRAVNDPVRIDKTLASPT